MIGNIGTGIGSICGVLSNGKVMAKDRAVKSDSPFWGVEAYDIDCCVFWNAKSDE